jgi:carboxymethylenebutenolidase
MFAEVVIKPTLGAALALFTLLLVACDPGSDGPAPAADTEQPADTSGEVAQVPATTEVQRTVVSDQLPYAEIDDELVYGYFVFPSDMIEPLPAVIMFHERWGLTDDVRKRADKLAAEGHIVLAVDLFNGKTTNDPSVARALMTRVIEKPDPVISNIRSAFEFVNDTAGAPRTGALGWGFGGTWSMNAAILFGDEIDATVIYYGQITSDEDKLRTANSPVLGLFAGKDRSMPAESVEAFEQSMKRLRKTYDIHVYPQAGAGFANPSSNRFDAEVASDAWGRTLEFLKTHLSVSDDDRGSESG